MNKEFDPVDFGFRQVNRSVWRKEIGVYQKTITYKLRFACVNISDPAKYKIWLFERCVFDKNGWGEYYPHKDIQANIPTYKDGLDFFTQFAPEVITKSNERKRKIKLLTENKIISFFKKLL